MKRLSKQTNLLSYSQLIIVLFFIFDVVIGANLVTDLEQSEQQNQADSNRLTAILTNYHSDAEQILRNPNDNFENKSNAGQTNVEPTKIKYEQQLKVVKRSPRNYNFGLGKRSTDRQPAIDEKQAQIIESQIRKLLNYLYNLDINLIWSYLSNMNDEDLQQAVQSNKQLPNELPDDQEVDSSPSEKYKAKRDTIQRQRQYGFGLGKMLLCEQLSFLK